MINYKFIVNDYREYHVWHRERFQRIYIVWSSIFEPVMTIVNVNNPNFSLAFPVITVGIFIHILAYTIRSLI